MEERRRQNLSDKVMNTEVSLKPNIPLFIIELLCPIGKFKTDVMDDTELSFGSIVDMFVRKEV